MLHGHDNILWELQIQSSFDLRIELEEYSPKLRQEALWLLERDAQTGMENERSGEGINRDGCKLF